MINRTTVDTALITGGTAINGNGTYTGFATDSGKVKGNDLFICIKGQRVDGHRFAPDAVRNGASAVLCDRRLDVNVPCVIVEDTVSAIQRLASDYRKKRDVKVVGVTGSVGKTTTKEFIYSVLSASVKTHKTEGNKNSETGLPITVLGIDPDDKMCVAEMGMSGKGEISLLSRIALPDIAVITNIGYSHIDNLGSLENILDAKFEILDGLNPNGTLVLNGDDKMLFENKNRFGNVVTSGYKNKNVNVFASNITNNGETISFDVSVIGINGIDDTSFPVVLNVAGGNHYVTDALLAISVGLLSGLETDLIKKGLSAFEKTPGRNIIYDECGYTIIDDTYNASPDPVCGALEGLSERKSSGNKIAVLGDMLGLGTYSDYLHRMVGEHIRGIDYAVLFGDFAYAYAEGAKAAGMQSERIYVCADRGAALDKLLHIAREGDCILFKASHDMRADEIINGFLQEKRN